MTFEIGDPNPPTRAQVNARIQEQVGAIMVTAGAMQAAADELATDEQASGRIAALCEILAVGVADLREWVRQP